ncbi:MAG: FAD-binding oxidoreductase [Burkholderiales bacterium]|nr:FAD-binding oxidoreductase [Burkholderiales bacterium]
MKLTADAIVIGGGLVASAVAYGLTRLGLKPVMLDEGDVAYRASRGNFALVWTQSKGPGVPEYQQWSRLSSDKWSELAAELQSETGVDCGHRRNGGIHVCLSEDELAKRTQVVEQLRAEAPPGRYRAQMISRAEMLKLLPAFGPDVVGGAYCPDDGTVNPLFSLRALQRAFSARGGRYFCDSRVSSIAAAPRAFTVETASRSISAPRLVLAAGLGNKPLGEQVGLNVPVRPVRGQIIVTERLKPVLEYPTTYIRQTVEGGILIGESREEAGFDDTLNHTVSQTLAARAIRTFPFLKQVGVVRTWAGLRVMSPDVYPIYEQSSAYPGAFVCTCHSGVTLGAAHAFEYAKAVVDGHLPEKLGRFSSRRFDVQARH